MILGRQWTRRSTASFLFVWVHFMFHIHVMYLYVVSLHLALSVNWTPWLWQLITQARLYQYKLLMFLCCIVLYKAYPPNFDTCRCLGILTNN